MPTPEARVARIEAGQEFFRDALVRLEQGQDRLARRVDHVADEVRRNSEATSKELHEAALALKEVAGEMKSGDGRMRDIENDLSELREDVDANTAWRWRSFGATTVLGLVGGWIASHWK